MKKLFTLCASALLAFTLSAQADQAKGSMYLGITDATAMFDAFGDDSDMNLTFTAGYAVQDGLVVMISSGQDQHNVYTYGTVDGAADGWNSIAGTAENDATANG